MGSGLAPVSGLSFPCDFGISGEHFSSKIQVFKSSSNLHCFPFEKCSIFYVFLKLTSSRNVKIFSEIFAAKTHPRYQKRRQHVSGGYQHLLLVRELQMYWVSVWNPRLLDVLLHVWVVVSVLVFVAV